MTLIEKLRAFGRLMKNGTEHCLPMVGGVADFSRIAGTANLQAGDIWEAADKIVALEADMLRLQAERDKARKERDDSMVLIRASVDVYHLRKLRERADAARDEAQRELARLCERGAP